MEVKDRIIMDLEMAQEALAHSSMPRKFNKVLEKYLKPFGKNVWELSWTGDFVDIVGVENAENALQELTSNANLSETCTAGCTGVANVATCPSPFASTVKRSKPKTKTKKTKANESFDVLLFKMNMESGFPVVCTINEHKLEYDVVDGSSCLFVDGNIVKSLDKATLNMVVEEVIYNKPISVELLEGFNVFDLKELISEDVTEIGATDGIGKEDIDQTEDVAHKEDLKKQIGSSNNVVVDLESGEYSENQELVGYDEQEDSFVTKDSQTGDIKIVKSNRIMKQ
jgi:hypothetical protein